MSAPAQQTTDSDSVLLAPIPAIEAFLGACVRNSSFPPNLREAIEYAAMGGGKRLRPILAWHACEAMGVPGDRSLPAGCALELIHSFSLVHDDLPALDNDDLRRGRPSLHKHTSEAMAILAGDAMLSSATGVILECAFQPQALALCKRLVQAANAMIGGQVLDTVGGFAENEPQESRLIRIHLGKTGALIEAACTMGAISGMQDPDDEENEIFLEAISEYGSAVGHMFQIVDDLIDVEQSTEHTGKKTKKDAAGGKLTYPGVYGVDRSKREVESLRMLAHEHLEPFGPRAAALHTLSDALARRTR